MSIAWADHGVMSRLDREEERRHELRAALFGIEASAQGLSRYRAKLTSFQLDQLAQALVEEVRRVRTLLEGRPSETATFDLADAIRAALAGARESGQQVHAVIPRGIAIEGCRDRVAQVVVALLDNARHHAPGSPVELRASVRGCTVTLWVEDRGPGVDDTLRDRVFDRGVSGDQGSGLGLFVARRLMTEQGGSITVGPRPGGGTSFALEFKRAAGR